MAASVWMALVIVISTSCSLTSPMFCVDTGRSSADTIPVVTLSASPSGLPRAMTGSPTNMSSDDPMGRGVRSSGTVSELQDCDVRLRVTPHEGGGDHRTVGHDDLHFAALGVCGGHDVVVRDDVALVVVDETGAEAGDLAVHAHLDRGDAGGGLVCDLRPVRCLRRLADRAVRLPRRVLGRLDATGEASPDRSHAPPPPSAPPTIAAATAAAMSAPQPGPRRRGLCADGGGPPGGIWPEW